MRRDAFFIILLVLGGLAVLCNLAFIVYLGITISSVMKGLSFLPAVFPSLCIALAVVNGVTIAYSILYIFVLRR